MNISFILLDWYDENKRDLPWRNTDNPYVIWIAEVVFQQTRIEQGLPFFVRFMEAFPKINILASAKEEEVLKLWQGLGYYSRARNLHYSAKYIMTELDGKFPSSYKDLLQLKGVGPYIAAEVASVCFNEVVAAVDGNVQRVIARYFGIEEAVNDSIGAKSVSALANAHISKKRPGDFNQALMDLGSSVCTPKNPLCNQCVLNELCWANRNSKQLVIPVKKKKVKVRSRHLNFLLRVDEGKLAMQKRKSGDVWQGLFQPLLIETKAELVDISELGSKGFFLSKSIRVLSHQKLFLKFWVLEEINISEFEDVEWVKLEEIETLPVPKSIEQLFSSNEFNDLYNMRVIN